MWVAEAHITENNNFGVISHNARAEHPVRTLTFFFFVLMRIYGGVNSVFSAHWHVYHQ